VWGALGFLGYHLVTRLLDSGKDVSVLCRSKKRYPTPVWSQRVRWFELESGGSLESNLLAAVARAAVIYNFAGASGAVASNREPVRNLRDNCALQLAFLTACERAGHKPHVVYPSSWLVYAPADGKPVREDHPIGPLSVYGAHKACIEHYFRIFGARDRITWTVCRISNPYGFDPAMAKGAYKVLNWFVDLALGQKPISIFGDGSQLRDFVYIEDVVDALVSCGFSAVRNEIFNIGGGRSYSLIDAVEIINELAGPVPVIFKTWPEEYHAVEPGDYVGDISRARRRLGFHPAYDLRSGLAQTIRDYRSESHALARRSAVSVVS
jgi:UDP-glucose 4-epimerase